MSNHLKMSEFSQKSPIQNFTDRSSTRLNLDNYLNGTMKTTSNFEDTKKF